MLNLGGQKARKLSYDDDIDNGVDVVMPDDDDWSVIKNTITETLPRILDIRCEVMELVMR